MDLAKCFINLHKATLHPPALWRRPEDDDDAAAGIPWVLLDLEAYVADRRNATTAYARSESGKEIQVTLVLARPPQVSYFCVFCPGRDHTTEFPTEPKILAMDENLVLLKIIVSPEKETLRDRDFYVYQANGAEDGGPSLERLPRPPGRCLFDHNKVGLLRCRDDHGGDGSSVLRRHRIKKDDFVVAAIFDFDQPGVGVHFTDEDFRERPGLFALFVYNSKCQTWSINAISLDQQQLQKKPGIPFSHFNSKVLAIGGEAGTMGFVDLWQGILLCDVLTGNPNLSFVPLPKPKLQDRAPIGEACLHRDIAIIEGHIKYVELETLLDPSFVSNRLVSNRRYGRNGWMAWRYSRPVAAASSVAALSSSSDDWRMECSIESSSDISVNTTTQFELLPKRLDSEGQPLPPFKGLTICHPVLSLSDDDNTVYFMNKIFLRDEKAWVIAVNMVTKELVGVAKFAAERTEVVPFAYAHSRISKYLTGTSGAGAKGSLKRPGCLLMRSSSKKQPSPLISLGSWLEHQEGERVDAHAEDTNNMILG